MTKNGCETPPLGKTVDQKREDYRKYLEQAGLIEVLTRTLANLYSEGEKPQDPIRYILEQLGGSVDGIAHKDAYNNDLEDLRNENAELKEENARLKADLGKTKAQQRLSLGNLPGAPSAAQPALTPPVARTSAQQQNGVDSSPVQSSSDGSASGGGAASAVVKSWIKK